MDSHRRASPPIGSPAQSPLSGGLTARNHFRPAFEIRWAEIERFIVRPYGLTPQMGHVLLRDGGTKNISSIAMTNLDALLTQTRGAQELIDELNALAEGVRAGRVSIPSEM